MKKEGFIISFHHSLDSLDDDDEGSYPPITSDIILNNAFIFFAYSTNSGFSSYIFSYFSYSNFL